MRRTVWTAFEITLALIVIGIAVFIATLLMRFGLKLAEMFVVKYLPFMLQTMWADKWYILAFILGALLLWSWPASDEQPDWQPSPVRRGRHIERFPRAAPRSLAGRGGARPASFTVRRQFGDQPHGDRCPQSLHLQAGQRSDTGLAGEFFAPQLVLH